MPHSNAKPSTSKNVSNSRAKRSTRDREKRKSQSNTDKNDDNTTAKTSPSKDSYKYTGLCKDLIRTWSEPFQAEYLSDRLCSGVAEDLSYRLRLVIHDALTKARLCGRNSILASDIDDTLQVLKVDKIYGPAKAPQFTKDEVIINLTYLSEYNVSYPQPADIQMTRSWLPMTTTVIAPTDTDSSNSGQTVVSAALSHYHRVVCRALVTPTSPRHRSHALHDLRTSSHIGPIVDWLYSFAYRVLSKDVSYGGPTTTQAALDLIEALEANVQAVSQVSNKVIELLVRLLLQRILRTCAESSLLRPMCVALALLCDERNVMRELVIGKLIARAAGCAGSNNNGSDNDGAVSIVTAAQVLGIEAVERVILPEATLMGLLCRVAKRADNELTTALKLTYYTICKEYNGYNRLEIDDLFQDTFNYALLPMWVQPPYKQEAIIRDYNPDWVYSQLVKSRRIINYKIPKIKKEDTPKKMTLQQIFPSYHICCNCRKVKTTNFFTPKNVPQFKFTKTATKCVKCVPIKIREDGLKPKLMIGKRKLLISVFKDEKSLEKSLSTCYINTFRFHVL